MADYSNYPAYRAAVEKVQKLQMRLTGSKGSAAGGLEQAMANVAAKKGRDSQEFIDIKTQFDALQEEIKKAKEDAAAMREQIDAEDVAKEKEKEKSTFSKTLNRLRQERDTFKDRNDMENAAAKQAEIDAFKRSATPEEETVEETDGLYGKYTLGVDGKTTDINGIVTYFIGEPDDKNEIAQTPYQSLAKARDAFLKKYTEPGQISKLQKQLLDANYIKQSDIQDKTWVEGVDDLIRNYTYQSVSDVKYGGVKEPIALTEFLNKKKLSGTGGSKSYSTITKRGDAKKDLDEYMLDLRGTPSTPEEEEAYYKKLRAAEQKAVYTVGEGFTTGRQLDEADHILIAVEVAKKSLKGTDVEKLLSSGGRVANDIADLQEYSANYGIEMSAGDALKYVATGLGQKDYIAKQQERIRQTAITLNPQLKDHFIAGGTYKDIADQYKNTKQRKLGITITDSLKDKDITDAISRGTSINDFNTQLQGKAEWRKTPEANSIVDGFINKLGEMWGLG
jgi:hypothetical protein